MYACPKVSLDKGLLRAMFRDIWSNSAITPSIWLLRLLSTQAQNLQASHCGASVKSSYEGGEVE